MSLNRCAIVKSKQIATNLEIEKKRILHLTMNLSLVKRSIKFVRYFCTESKSNNVKSFEEIPGPVGPFGMGTLYNYLPIIGISSVTFDKNRNSLVECYANV